MNHQANQSPTVCNLRQETQNNSALHHTVLNGSDLQCTVMCVRKGEEAGIEPIKSTDRFFYVESGKCRCTFSQNPRRCAQCAQAGDCIFVPSGTECSLCSVGDTPLKLFTVDSPAERPVSSCRACDPE